MTIPTSSQTSTATALFDGSIHDPFPAYAELRESADGVHWAEPLGGYLVTRYHDVREISANIATFSNDKFSQTAAGRHDPNKPEHLRFVDSASQLFAFSDPPAHTRVRSAFRHAFTPTAVDGWRSTVEDLTDELIGNHARGEEFDIMSGFAAEVPVAVIAAILGVPREHHPKFRAWSHAFASTLDPVVQGPRRDEAITTSLELFDYLEGLISERRAEPREDLISTLVTTETADGGVLTVDELVSQVAFLLAAGNETTTTLIGSALTMLFDFPEMRKVVAEDRSLVPSAIEETLRMDPSLHLVSRLTTQDTVLGQYDVPAGSLVYLCTPAANRDPRRFDDPDTFRLGREDNKHLAFLHGIHFCVGAPLARLEVRVVLDYILRTFPDLRAGHTPPVRTTSNVISRGWKTRPVIL